MKVTGVWIGLLLLICVLLATYFTRDSESEVLVVPENKASTQLVQQFLIFPPYWQQIGEHTFSGTHYRLAQALYQHANLTVKFINTPYQRMQFQVAQGKVPFINYGEKAGQHTEELFHICVPPTEIRLKVYYVKEQLEKIYELSDFDHKNVIIVHGLPLGEYESIKDNETINFMTPRTIDAAMTGLKQGRGDYFITFDNLMNNVDKYFQEQSLSLKSYPLYTLLGYPIVTPKSYPNGKPLCDKVRQSYDQLVVEGVIDSKRKILKSDVQQGH